MRSSVSETLYRAITCSRSSQASSSRSNLRQFSASASADSFYHSQWEEHWWLDPESWASGGTWQNSTYDDYNYQYQWTKTWQGQGEPQVSSSASNRLPRVENGPGGGLRARRDKGEGKTAAGRSVPWSR